ncbi:hypothetical protein ABIA95_009159 [Bradyrhizobium sp. LA8.1]
MATGRTFTTRSARTTRMRVLAIPTSPSQSPLGGRQSSPTWATPPWRTGMARMLTLATGTAERRSSEGMLKINKAYDTADHKADRRALIVTPHVTQNNGITKTGKNRRSAIDERTTRRQRYGMPQSRRAMIESIFGWGKQHGTMRKSRHLSHCSRFRAQPDRLQPDPRSETRPDPPSKITPNNRPHHQGHAYKRKTNAVPRQFQFQGGGYRRSQACRPPMVCTQWD